MPTLDPHDYYVELAACFCRGRLGLRADAPIEDVLDQGRRAGLRLSKFKRNAELPRVRRVLGALRGLVPTSLLDVGSGRGTFLWPLLDQLPDVAVTAIDRDPQRASDLEAMTRGGLARLTGLRMDATALSFADRTFDGVTLLEVLEHMPDPSVAIREAVRVAQRFVVLSVPAHEDDNPEHLHLLDEGALRAMFAAAGATRLRFDAVLNHRVAVVALGQSP